MQELALPLGLMVTRLSTTVSQAKRMAQTGAQEKGSLLRPWAAQLHPEARQVEEFLLPSGSVSELLQPILIYVYESLRICILWIHMSICI